MSARRKSSKEALASHLRTRPLGPSCVIRVSGFSSSDMDSFDALLLVQAVYETGTTNWKKVSGIMKGHAVLKKKGTAKDFSQDVRSPFFVPFAWTLPWLMCEVADVQDALRRARERRRLGRVSTCSVMHIASDLFIPVPQNAKRMVSLITAALCRVKMLNGLARRGPAQAREEALRRPDRLSPTEHAAARSRLQVCPYGLAYHT